MSSSDESASESDSDEELSGTEASAEEASEDDAASSEEEEPPSKKAKKKAAPKPAAPRAAARTPPPPQLAAAAQPPVRPWGMSVPLRVPAAQPAPPSARPAAAAAPPPSAPVVSVPPTTEDEEEPDSEEAAPRVEVEMAPAELVTAAQPGPPPPRPVTGAFRPPSKTPLSAPHARRAPPSAAAAPRSAPARAAAASARRAVQSDSDEDGGARGGSESESEFEVEGDEEEERAVLKAANTRAMLSGTLQVRRAAFMPRLLSVTEAAVVLRQPFIPPNGKGAPGAVSDELRHKLMAGRIFVPWGSKGGPPKLFAFAPRPEAAQEELPPGVEPLQLWPAPGAELPEGCKPIMVDNMLCKWLRAHQREGVQFLFECVAGMRPFAGTGCILADDMGLGKTLQAITLLWTLLRQGTEPSGVAMAKRVIIVCPTSLVANWDQECEKWLKGRVRTLPIAEACKADVISSVTQFLQGRGPTPPQVLIISYETFRLHSARFNKADACDLLICDEAHRLKNDDTLTCKALDSLVCRRRVLLSGTPIQNKLDEFYAMVSFANPGVLGSHSEFHKKYESPILAGREPDSSEAQQARGAERSLELSAAVDAFILRRTNALLSAHLPPKTIQIVCCRLSTLQVSCYSEALASKAAKRIANGKDGQVLGTILDLKKLCNHPKLIYDDGVNKKGSEAMQSCMASFTPGMFDDGRFGRGQSAPGWELHGGKFDVLARLLDWLRRHTSDRIVLISNYTQTLDLFAQLCKERRYPFLRLDGTIAPGKRQQLVKRFNDPHDNQFAFLLSSKAGGCGLNLIGGNRLVLFDPDWNPANDKQAAGRVWRDGQKKQVYVYRFLATGTIEEKVYQRQLSKEGLQNLVDAKGKVDMAMMCKDDLRKLFILRGEESCSDTHDFLKCKRCPRKPSQEEVEAAEAAAAALAAIPVKEDDGGPPHQQQVGKPAEDDLGNWGHHEGSSTVPDEALRFAGADGKVSFVFVCKIDGKAVEPEPPISAAQSAMQCAGTAGPSRMGSARLQQPRAPLAAIQQPPRPAAPACPPPAAAAAAAPPRAAPARACTPPPPSAASDEESDEEEESPSPPPPRAGSARAAAAQPVPASAKKRAKTTPVPEAPKEVDAWDDEDFIV